MADAIISGLLTQLDIILVQQVEQEVTLVVGVEEQVKSLTRTFDAIQAVLDDAEKRQAQEATVRRWLNELKDASYDVEDVLDEWNTAILRYIIEEKVDNNGGVINKVCNLFSLPCFCFNRVALRHDIALKIKELNERLDVIAMGRERYKFKEGRETLKLERQVTAHVTDVSEIHGRNEDKKRLLSMLLSDSFHEPNGLHVVSIVGMGGLGKTTLARLVYNSNEVHSYFEKKMWVCVSDPFDEIRVARAILESLTGVGSNVIEFAAILQKIHESVEGRRFFLVLDDVWSDDYKKWEQLKTALKWGSLGSRILVTTRKETVAKMMGTVKPFELVELTEDECWRLFSEVAFYGKNSVEHEDFDDLSHKIARKCKGLPLAAKTLGSQMRFKESIEEWENVLRSGIWGLEDGQEGLFPPLLLSYYDLPSTVRRCFSYCAILPKNGKIRKDELVQMWMAQGYLNTDRDIEMEEVGEEYFRILATRSFFQDFKKSHGNVRSCKMHDIVHDFALYLTKGECFIADSDGSNSSHVQARHLRMELKSKTMFPLSAENMKKLHSIMVSFGQYGYGALTNLFDQVTYVRTLDLSKPQYSNKRSSIKELLETVGKLIHLRFLKLSGNEDLKTLPESLCELCNLQTLKISKCLNLETLPRGMGKLIKLRWLENRGTNKLSFMPKGMKNLTSLRTIREFVVRGHDDGDGDDNEAMSLGDLKLFNELRGKLRVRGLGNVIDVEEAKKAELVKKKHLRSLYLEFEGDVGESKTHDELLEALQPPHNLEVLTIYNKRGVTLTFPNWLMCLTKLSFLSLDLFRELEHLPPLGKLASLENLELWYMFNVKKVSVEFLGIDTDFKSSSSSSVIIVFPRLKELTFGGLVGWEEWDDSILVSSNISIMPQLRSLHVVTCDKLKGLPYRLLERVPLEELTIWQCCVLEKSCRKKTGDDWHKICHIPNVKIDEDYVQKRGD